MTTIINGQEKSRASSQKQNPPHHHHHHHHPHLHLHLHLHDHPYPHDIRLHKPEKRLWSEYNPTPTGVIITNPNNALVKKTREIPQQLPYNLHQVYEFDHPPKWQMLIGWIYRIIQVSNTGVVSGFHTTNVIILGGLFGILGGG